MSRDKRCEADMHRTTGVRLGVINTALTVIAVAFSILLMLATRGTLEGFDGLERATERNITCQQNAILFQEASDYLTSECRYFAITGDPIHAQNFIEEVEVTRRRENAIEGIDEFLTEQASYDYLIQAMEYSSALAERECYAMRLAADAWNCPPEALPARIAQVELTPEDAALSPEAKRALAIDMLFGSEYQDQKANIYGCVEKSISALIDVTRQQQIESSDHLSRLLGRQRLLIMGLLLIMFAVVACTYLLVIRPLNRAVSHMRDKRELPVAGAYEMQFLAQTYNDMFAQNARSTEELTYSATHDSLTGVFNRTAYDAEYRRVDRSTIGVLIVDVDKFKEYNDNYGHDVGDLVLQRVAKVLVDSFRSNDFVSRIGGDEFCIIMKNANSSMRELVAEKIRRANDKLQHPEDGLPSVSLSVGVAFGDRENPSGDIFKDADTALYRVKRGKRGTCDFY